MMRQGEIETRIDTHDAGTQSASNPSSLSFASLAGDLRTVWNAPTTDARLKKRIVRTLIHGRNLLHRLVTAQRFKRHSSFKRI
jgi:hypothetical protein